MSTTEYVMGFGPATSIACAEKCEHGTPCIEGAQHSVYHRGVNRTDFEDHTWTTSAPGVSWACVVEEYEHYTDGEDDDWDEDIA